MGIYKLIKNILENSSNLKIVIILHKNLAICIGQTTNILSKSQHLVTFFQVKLKPVSLTREYQIDGGKTEFSGAL